MSSTNGLTNTIELTTMPTVSSGISEKPLWLCESTGLPVSPSACLNCSNHNLLPCDYTPSILSLLQSSLLTSDESVPGGLTIRVSSLTGCKRKSWYQLNQPEEPLEKPSQHWARLRGNVFHNALETSSAFETESRYNWVVYPDGKAVTISGRVDEYSEDSSTLTDYKTTKNAPKTAQPSHVRQFWLYTWLLRMNGKEVKKIRVSYIDMAKVRTHDIDPPNDQDMIDIFHSVESAAGDITSPDIPPAIPSEKWECSYCPFTQCEKNIRKQS